MPITFILEVPEVNTTMAVYQAGTYDVKPLDGMLRTIAQRLTLSKQTVPYFYLSNSVISRNS